MSQQWPCLDLSDQGACVYWGDIRRMWSLGGNSQGPRHNILQRTFFFGIRQKTNEENWQLAEVSEDFTFKK